MEQCQRQGRGRARARTDHGRRGGRARFRFGNNSLDATFGLDAGDSLALLCDRKTGIASAIGNLANNCLLASLGADGNSRHSAATAAFSRGGTRFGVGVGDGRDTLPAWLTPGTGPTKVDVNDLTVFAQIAAAGGLRFHRRDRGQARWCRTSTPRPAACS